MTIVIDEMTAEVAPPARREGRGPQREESGSQPRQLEDKVRALLVRERRRAERLSDR